VLLPARNCKRDAGAEITTLLVLHKAAEKPPTEAVIQQSSHQDCQQGSRRSVKLVGQHAGGQRRPGGEQCCSAASIVLQSPHSLIEAAMDTCAFGDTHRLPERDNDQ
jgi:hypothetical protein